MNIPQLTAEQNSRVQRENIVLPKGYKWADWKVYGNKTLPNGAKNYCGCWSDVRGPWLNEYAVICVPLKKRITVAEHNKVLEELEALRKSYASLQETNTKLNNTIAAIKAII